MARRKREIPLVHPGEILVEEFLKPLGMTSYGKRSVGTPRLDS